MLEGIEHEKLQVIETIKKLVFEWSNPKGKTEADENPANRILEILSQHPDVKIDPNLIVTVREENNDSTEISLFDLAKTQGWEELTAHLSAQMPVRPPSPKSPKTKGVSPRAHIIEADPYENPQTFMQFVEELATQGPSVAAEKIKSGLFSHAVKKENIEVLKKILQFNKEPAPIFNLSLADNENKNAFSYAIKEGNLQALRLILNYFQHHKINIAHLATYIMFNAPESLLTELLLPENADLYKMILATPTNSEYTYAEMTIAEREKLNGTGVDHGPDLIRLADLRIKFALGKEPTQKAYDEILQNHRRKKFEETVRKEKVSKALFEISKIKNISEIDQVIAKFDESLCLEILKAKKGKEGNNLYISAMNNDILMNNIAFKLYEKAYKKNPWSQQVVALIQAKTHGKTPIYAAAEANNASFINLFLKAAGTCENTGPKHCPSALMAAAQKGACEAVIEIIKLEPSTVYNELFNLKTKDENGLTLAHHLARFDKTGKAFCALLNNSSIKTAQPFRDIMLVEDKEGYSVFDCLMQNDNAVAVLKEIVNNMKTWRPGWGLEHIFDINSKRKNKHGFTDLEWLIKYASPEIKKIFRENIYDKNLYNAAFTKINSDENLEESSTLEPVTESQTKPTYCGVRVYTYGTRSHEPTGIMHQVDTKLYGGNVGHAAITLIIPADAQGRELIKKYCLNPPIPYQKQKITTAKSDDKMAAVHEEEVYVINWSWWPGSDGRYFLNPALNVDGLSEREGVHRPVAPQWATVFEQETRVHAGRLGSTRMAYGATGIAHIRGDITEEDKKILQFKATIPQMERKLASCHILVEKLDALETIKETVIDISNPKLMSKNTKDLIAKFLPDLYERLIKDKKTISSAEVAELILNAKNKETQLNDEHDQAKTELERLSNEKNEKNKQLQERYEAKKAEKEQLETQLQRDLVALEPLQKEENQFEEPIKNIEELLNYFKKIKQQSFPKEIKAQTIQALKDLNIGVDNQLKNNKLTKNGCTAIISELTKLLQEKKNQKSKYTSKIGNLNKKVNDTKAELDRVTQEFLQLQRDYWQIESQMPSARYQELVDHQEAVKSARDWCNDHLNKYNTDPITLQEGFPYWLQKSNLKKDLDPNFDPENDELKLSRAEIEALIPAAEEELKRIRSEIVDVEPCQGFFDAGENEQFLTMGTTPDHVLDLPLDAISIHQANQAKSANQLAEGLNAERMLSKMQEITSGNFNLARCNCSSTSLDILGAGADATCDVFAAKGYGNLDTPQVVYNNALAYQHRMHHDVSTSMVTKVNDTIARYSPFNMIEGQAVQVLANPESSAWAKAGALAALPVAMAGQLPRRAVVHAFRAMSATEQSSLPSIPQEDKRVRDKDEKVEQLEDNIVYIHAFSAEQALKVWEEQLQQHSADDIIPMLEASTNALFDKLAPDQKINLTEKYKALQKMSLDKMRAVQIKLEQPQQQNPKGKNQHKQ